MLIFLNFLLCRKSQIASYCIKIPVFVLDVIIQSYQEVRSINYLFLQLNNISCLISVFLRLHPSDQIED